uniref:Transmembrane protein n=2 Tax=Chromera velia CCMP2878 TaxID=1169474 RepID=A0A0G4HQ36_9ALVE|eukprot:Cvel_7871.t1-p1 / transcript=Cvel_7871.t1 / gene=Cvel_7871 / organism=Chromera_velia_CCMP2878 / gene_product=hypothetical protein / transcript_product=hypothetical protein / location=Cvel_scaffold421:85181-89267(+) / protein_length=281 / sequence_SO=supercontig / SO=protein_coding / is_pseudo=false
MSTADHDGTPQTVPDFGLAGPHHDMEENFYEHLLEEDAACLRCVHTSWSLFQVLNFLIGMACLIAFTGDPPDFVAPLLRPGDGEYLLNHLSVLIFLLAVIAVEPLLLMLTGCTLSCIKCCRGTRAHKYSSVPMAGFFLALTGLTFYASFGVSLWLIISEVFGGKQRPPILVIVFLVCELAGSSVHVFSTLESVFAACRLWFTQIRIKYERQPTILSYRVDFQSDPKRNDPFSRAAHQRARSESVRGFRGSHMRSASAASSEQTGGQQQGGQGQGQGPVALV